MLLVLSIEVFQIDIVLSPFYHASHNTFPPCVFLNGRGSLGVMFLVVSRFEETDKSNMAKLASLVSSVGRAHDS